MTHKCDLSRYNYSRLEWAWKEWQQRINSTIPKASRQESHHWMAYPEQFLGKNYLTPLQRRQLTYSRPWGNHLAFRSIYCCWNILFCILVTIFCSQFLLLAFLCEKRLFFPSIDHTLNKEWRVDHVAWFMVCQPLLDYLMPKSGFLFSFFTSNYMVPSN